MGVFHFLNCKTGATLRKGSQIKNSMSVFDNATLHISESVTTFAARLSQRVMILRYCKGAGILFKYSVPQSLFLIAS